MRGDSVLSRIQHAPSLHPPITSSLSQRGQATLEYALFVAVVAAALIAMNTYVRRAIQANVKSLEDAVNAEASAPVNISPPAQPPAPPPVTPPPPPPPCAPPGQTCL